MEGKEIKLVTDSGIQVYAFEVNIDKDDAFSRYYYEYYDDEKGKWYLAPLYEVKDEDGSRHFYRYGELREKGFMAKGEQISIEGINDVGIKPVKIDDELIGEETGEVYRYGLKDAYTFISDVQNRWLPIPYFYHNGGRAYFGPTNWSRFKIIPLETEAKATYLRYKVILALDTATDVDRDTHNERPAFQDNFANAMELKVCDEPMLTIDYCSPQAKLVDVNNYILKLIHPEVDAPEKLKTSSRKLSYITSYMTLVELIAERKLFPTIQLYRSKDRISQDVDLVIDIGNSRTTAVLVEGDFKQVEQLKLLDFTKLNDPYHPDIVHYQEPFDMRLVMRKASFGNIGKKDSQQFVYPSYVRLGTEANHLLYSDTACSTMGEQLTTLSSPKRYLWDGTRSEYEWCFIRLEGEEDESSTLYIPGLSEMLSSDGTMVSGGKVGGTSYHFSRRSMMTLSFLEIYEQALMHINSIQYRRERGRETTPRRIQNIIVTCPTTMSEIERHALSSSAKEASLLFLKYHQLEHRIEVVPAPQRTDDSPKWYYDEATCSQLVYIYGEIGHKYKGVSNEFFELYGHKNKEGKDELIVGSLDIGAGTSDLMVCQYSHYEQSGITHIKANPLFYDSFYYAGDDMMFEVARKVLFYSSNSALYKELSHLSKEEYRQKLRNFFGPDYAGQTAAQRELRREFNLQYIVPLMNCFLQKVTEGNEEEIVRYSELFTTVHPTRTVLEGFENYFGKPLEELEWKFSKEEVCQYIENAFDELLRLVAMIFSSSHCDVILLSGRPSSLPPIRQTLLKYYPVTPNRLILLNNYYVGDWYPFGNNTGFITNPKTVVAVGGLVGHYGAVMGNLEGFYLDTSLLGKHLKSVVNYVEKPSNSTKTEYLLTPETLSGELIITSLPACLRIRQLDAPSYPLRPLYVIDFNRQKMGEIERRKNPTLNDMQIQNKINEKVKALRLKGPYTVVIKRDADDLETLRIDKITDKEGNEIADSNIEINVQSLGIDNSYYWLDSGVFNIE